ncbi:hypothetical protein ACVWWG_007336 [Bradyrhizobium sp. LB7.2]
MPLMDAAGTRVDRIRPDSVKNSTPPERIWLSMSVSDPSWLFGKICRSNLPLVSALIAAAISLARTFIGWVSGRLLAYLKVNSALWARATWGAPMPPRTAVAAEALRSVRREKLMGLLPRKVCCCSEMQTIRTSGQKVICDLAKPRLLQPDIVTAISAFGCMDRNLNCENNPMHSSCRELGRYATAGPEMTRSEGAVAGIAPKHLI